MEIYYFPTLASFRGSRISRIPSPRCSWIETSQLSYCSCWSLLSCSGPDIYSGPMASVCEAPSVPLPTGREGSSILHWCPLECNSRNAPVGWGGPSCPWQNHTLGAHPEAVLLWGQYITSQKCSPHSYFPRPSRPSEWSAKLCSLLFGHQGLANGTSVLRKSSFSGCY